MGLRHRHMEPPPPQTPSPYPRLCQGAERGLARLLLEQQLGVRKDKDQAGTFSCFG